MAEGGRWAVWSGGLLGVAKSVASAAGPLAALAPARVLRGIFVPALATCPQRSAGATQCQPCDAAPGPSRDDLVDGPTAHTEFLCYRLPIPIGLVLRCDGDCLLGRKFGNPVSFSGSRPTFVSSIPHVVNARSCEKVRGVHARGIVPARAVVEDVEAVRDGTVRPFIGQAMCVALAGSRIGVLCNYTITSAGFAADPEPTAISLNDKLPESGFYRGRRMMSTHA